VSNLRQQRQRADRVITLAAELRQRVYIGLHVYRTGMCDLNLTESQHIVAALNEISGLAQQVGAHAISITETDYMDHEGLGEALAVLNDRVATAHQWVTEKPVQHS
jgi:hypothetical protein